MATVTQASVLARLQEKFSSAILAVEEPYQLLTLTTTEDSIIPMLQFLKEDAEMQFCFLTDICGVHYPDTAKPLAVVYHIHSFVHNIRVRIKVFLAEENLNIPTATPVFNSANWMERETYDFYGINFVGHPNLRRILNVDEMTVFPMRKEFPLEDPNRKDKHDEYFGR